MLKGDVRAGGAIVFHTKSGQEGPEISWAMCETVLPPGSIVFTRALQNLLTVVGDEPVEHGPLTDEEMRSRVSQAARNPRFDHEMLRSRFGQGR